MLKKVLRKDRNRAVVYFFRYRYTYVSFDTYLLVVDTNVLFIFFNLLNTYGNCLLFARYNV